MKLSDTEIVAPNNKDCYGNVNQRVRNTNVKQEKCAQDLEATIHHKVQLHSNHTLHLHPGV